ncbi:MAG: hypothetical protein US42_C0022G0005 [Candidatus Magasanikbacteria bacterium GW2011_GWC2_37_14]|uniref:Uncharacterized protein n=1 Tax=Candidatus Magasanikbacteria bacterium GW2011_GWC2_37_14 TaxID=1619046 RepID=A0A0G0GA21_9BACT|nr:MAG: hypothetical protein US42_C0022G0005 [Candidatus Magasanikbacteria bacterium GW2011_GWC2_37_14]
MTIINWSKKIFWFIIEPFFPFGRNLVKKLGYNPYPPRQVFALGFLNKNNNQAELEKHLYSQNFIINKVAWVDEGEIMSLRLLDGFEHQYHLRLFKDGEIRGHYELTPEYSPLGHLHDKETTAKTEEFKKILGNFLIS